MFSQHARSHWLLRGHMTSNNETVSRQNLWAGNIAKSMTSEGNSALCTIIRSNNAYGNKNVA